MQRVASVTDLLLFDVKLMDSAAHQKHTGVPNELILKNLKLLASEGHDIQVRVPCIPGINDSPDQIRDTSKFIANAGIKRIALLPYNSAAGAKYDWIGASYVLAERASQSKEQMQALAEICNLAGLEVQLGG